MSVKGEITKIVKRYVVYVHSPLDFIIIYRANNIKRKNKKEWLSRKISIRVQ